MRRLHLFEFEDQPWLPAVFRDFITDHLKYTHNEPMRQPISDEIARRLAALMRRAGQHRVVDLCAGAGGPIATISKALEREFGGSLEIVLTDLYPNVEAFKKAEVDSGGRIQARYQSTSALDVPAELDGVRTMFAALHHFAPEQARLVLEDAVKKRAAIAVFEPLERTLRMIALLGTMSFLRGFTHTHRVGRLTPLRMALTYLLPAAPAIFAWDGMVSALRTYSAEEMRALANEATGASGYGWEAGRFEVDGPFGPMPTIYLLGMPLSL